ncbi:MAG: M56 family metallopeptidase [Planctomycetaceae bacterium]|nr:M56 family metallopeptidase [Planctomycetaceae bacterium]
MNSVFARICEFPDSPILYQAILHFLWQGTLIAFLALVTTRIFCRRSSPHRYVTYTVALMACPVSLGATLIWCASETAHQSNRRESLTSEIARPAAETMTDVSPSKTQEQRVVDTTHLVSTPLVRSVTARASDPNTNDGAAANGASSAFPWHRWISMGYISGVVMLLLRLFVAFPSASRLSFRSQSLTDSHLLSLVQTQANRMGLRFVPMIQVSERISVPVVIGLLRPVILLPCTMITGLTTSEFAAVISHELAHIRRYDLWVNFVQRFVEAILFFHPAVWFLSQRVSTEREICCDDLSIAAGNTPTDFANSLLKMAELYLSRNAQLVGMAVTGRNSSLLEVRILRLLGAPSHSELYLTSRQTGLCAVASLLSFITAVCFLPYATAEEPQTNAAERTETTTSEGPEKPAVTEQQWSTVIAIAGEGHWTKAGDYVAEYFPNVHRDAACSQLVLILEGRQNFGATDVAASSPIGEPRDMMLSSLIGRLQSEQDHDVVRFDHRILSELLTEELTDQCDEKSALTEFRTRHTKDSIEALVAETNSTTKKISYLYHLAELYFHVGKIPEAQDNLTRMIQLIRSRPKTIACGDLGNLSDEQLEQLLVWMHLRNEIRALKNGGNAAAIADRMRVFSELVVPVHCPAFDMAARQRVRMFVDDEATCQKLLPKLDLYSGWCVAARWMSEGHLEKGWQLVQSLLANPSTHPAQVKRPELSVYFVQTPVVDICRALIRAKRLEEAFLVMNSIPDSPAWQNAMVEYACALSEYGYAKDMETWIQRMPQKIARTAMTEGATRIPLSAVLSKVKEDRANIAPPK